MTGDEMERAIEFLLESHAALTVKIDRLTENQDRLEATVGELGVTVGELGATVGALGDTVSELGATVGALGDTVGTLAEEAAADRAEIRAAVNTMLSFAESMADDVKLLALAQRSTTKRMTDIETRVDSLENRGT